MKDLYWFLRLDNQTQEVIMKKTIISLFILVFALNLFSQDVAELERKIIVGKWVHESGAYLIFNRTKQYGGAFQLVTNDKIFRGEWIIVMSKRISLLFTVNGTRRFLIYQYDITPAQMSEDGRWKLIMDEIEYPHGRMVYSKTN